jgi:large subunit ribosomal protein L17
MRHRVHTFKIGRSGAHRKAMLANMVSSLIEHGQIKTTITKAKEARRFADKMITLGKKGDLHRRRLAISKMRNKDMVKKLFDEIAPQYSEREGGYTRIIKLSQRIGDGAEMCLLQLVEAGAPAAKKTKPAAEVVEEVKAEEVVEAAEDTVEEVKAEEAVETEEAVVTEETAEVEATEEAEEEAK